MRFLADENVSVHSVRLLRDRGLDLVSVLETNPGLSDPDVIQLARRLGRALVTFDSDTGERIFKDGDPPPPSVLYLRFIQRDPEETARVVLRVLALDAFRLAESFVTYRNGRVRHQPLPPVRTPRTGEAEQDRQRRAARRRRDGGSARPARPCGSPRPAGGAHRQCRTARLAP